MIICEHEFIKPDFLRPDYSQHEVDYYAWTLSMHGDVPSHRLSIRKNLKSGEFETYRYYHTPRIVSLQDKDGKDTSQTVSLAEEVIYHGSLDGAVAVANAEVSKYHGWRQVEADLICRHEPPVQAPRCPVR